VVKEIRKLREKGKTVPQIAEELMMSYTVVNQVVLRSYKMVARTQEVFERQEQMRLADG
jgi:orotate phosphoribosyltransferase-like protein